MLSMTWVAGMAASSFAAAKTYGAHGVGFDINPERIKEANENAKKAGVENLVRFEENDLFKADIRDATVVTLFLLPKVNLRLPPKLLKELETRYSDRSQHLRYGRLEARQRRDTQGRGLLSKDVLDWRNEQKYCEQNE